MWTDWSGSLHYRLQASPYRWRNLPSRYTTLLRCWVSICGFRRWIRYLRFRAYSECLWFQTVSLSHIMWQLWYSLVLVWRWCAPWSFFRIRWDRKTGYDPYVTSLSFSYQSLSSRRLWYVLVRWIRRTYPVFMCDWYSKAYPCWSFSLPLIFLVKSHKSWVVHHQ